MHPEYSAITTAIPYELGKLLSLLLYPLSQALLLGLLALLALHLRRVRTAFWALALGTSWLYLCSTALFADYLMGTLEDPFPPKALSATPQADIIVLLGGAIRGDVHMGTLGDLSQSADRLVHAVALYKAGKAGIIFDGTWNIAGFVETLGAENVAIDPWPAYGDGALSGYVQTDNIYLGANATGDDQAAGWAFMEYFLSPEAQTILGDVAHIPATLGVEVTDPHLQQAAVAFEGGTAFPVIPEMGAYWSPFDTAIQSVLNEGTDPAEALQAAYDAIVAAIAEIRGGQ